VCVRPRIVSTFLFAEIIVQHAKPINVARAQRGINPDGLAAAKRRLSAAQFL
jgi:hypothetical protein